MWAWRSSNAAAPLVAPVLRALIAAAIAVALPAGGCRPAGDVPPREPEFVPNANFTLQTPEFDVEVVTNDLGFRGGPVPPPAPGRVRIAVLGDSFTFGQGVEAAQAWPARLESRLRARGVDVEVLNLGLPGAAPHDYVRIAERALAALRPQIVVVALVQGDDLVEALRPSPAAKLGSMQVPARERAEQAFSSLSADERSRLAAIDPKARALFESGGVDPSLVVRALRQPGCFLEPVEKNAVELQPHVAAMRDALKKIKAIAGSIGARTVAIGVPHPFYVSSSAQRNLGLMGFRVSATAIDSTQPNRLVRDAVLAAGFDGERVRGPAAAFRRFAGRPRTPRYFFHWDNHLNVAGHEELAAQVAKFVRRQIAAVQQK